MATLSAVPMRSRAVIAICYLQPHLYLNSSIRNMSILKNLIGLTLVLSTGLFVSAQSPDELKANSTSEMNLKGSVKSIKISAYEAADKFGEIMKTDLEYVVSYAFDEKGNEVEEIRYSSDGEIKSKEISTYDAQSKLKDAVIYNDDGDLENKWALEHDDKGAVHKVLFYDDDGELEWQCEMDVDDSGKSSTNTCYDDEGEVEQKTMAELNGSGQVQKKRVYDERGRLEYIKAYTYFPNGKIESCVSYEGDGEFEMKESYEYNDNGELSSTGIMNEKGVHTEKTTFRLEESDDRGNWQRKVVLKNGIVPQRIIEREISYY